MVNIEYLPLELIISNFVLLIVREAQQIHAERLELNQSSAAVAAATDRVTMATEHTVMTPDRLAEEDEDMGKILKCFILSSSMRLMHE